MGFFYLALRWRPFGRCQKRENRPEIKKKGHGHKKKKKKKKKKSTRKMVVLSCQTHRKACSKEHVTPEACFALRLTEDAGLHPCADDGRRRDLAPTLGKRVPHGFLGMSEKPRAGKFVVLPSFLLDHDTANTATTVTMHVRNSHKTTWVSDWLHSAGGGRRPFGHTLQ